MQAWKRLPEGIWPVRRGWKSSYPAWIARAPGKRVEIVSPVVHPDQPGKGGHLDLDLDSTTRLLADQEVFRDLVISLCAPG